MSPDTPWFAPFVVIGLLIVIGFYLGSLYASWRFQRPAADRWTPPQPLPPTPMPSPPPEPPVAIGVRFWCLGAQVLCLAHQFPNGQPGMHCTTNNGHGTLVDIYFSPGMYEAVKLELARCAQAEVAARIDGFIKKESP